MEHVYYTLVGILAMAGIGLVLVSLYKLVMFLGDAIDDWWNDRKSIAPARTPQIVWANDGSTGRIVTDKPMQITPNQLRALQGLSPFHKHNYKLIRARHDSYEFVCGEDGCLKTVELPKHMFWDGSAERHQLYCRYVDAVRDHKGGALW